MIGIVGASGAVGRSAVAALTREGYDRLRLAGRDGQRLAQAAELAPQAHTVSLDLTDPAALAEFCTGCEVVLNCAGPAGEVGTVVADACLRAGADYVDAAGDDALLARVTRLAGGDPLRTSLISAGMMPGLTGLLPRILASQCIGELLGLSGCAGGRDRFTLTAAADFLDSAAVSGTTGAIRHDGRIIAKGYPREPVEAPFFPEPVVLIPFLSTEITRFCDRLGIPNANWYSAYAGERLQAGLRAGPAAVDAAQRLAHAAELDVFGRRTYQMIVVELVTAEGACTLVLRGRGASQLTGEFAALSAAAVLRHNVPSGVFHAGEVLDVVQAMAWLRGSPEVEDFSVIEQDAARAGQLVEEAL